MPSQQYERSRRVNELLREILAEEVSQSDDTRLDLVTVSGVEVDQGLENATVYYSSMGGEEQDDEVLEGLEANRRNLQSAIARQARLRSTPRLSFAPDSGIREGERIEEILRDIKAGEALEPPDGD